MSIRNILLRRKLQKQQQQMRPIIASRQPAKPAPRRFPEYNVWTEVSLDSAFLLPVDTIYYLASATDAGLNDYVRLNLREIEAYLQQHTEGYFPLRLEYVERNSEHVSRFYPKQVWGEAAPGGAGTASNRLGDATLLTRLLPREGEDDVACLFCAGTGALTPEQLISVLHDYAARLCRLNRQIMLDGFDAQADRAVHVVRTRKPEAIVPEITVPLLDDAPCCSCEEAGASDSIRFSIVPADEEEEELGSLGYHGRFSVSRRSGESMVDFVEDLRRQQKLEEERFLREEQARKAAVEIRNRIEELDREGGIGFLSQLLGQELIDRIRAGRTVRESKVLVDEELRILLPGYDLSISMGPLPQALYLLFLRHPEGIDRFCLDDYSRELLQLYMRTSSREDTAAMRETIRQLTEPGAPALDQNISRANRAIRQQLAEELAAPFLIDGPRGERKRIRAEAEMKFTL